MIFFRIINKIQIKIFRFLKEIFIFNTIFTLCGRGALPLRFYDVMIK